MLLKTSCLILRPFQLQDYSHLHAHHTPTIEPHPNQETTLFDELDLFMSETSDTPIEKYIQIAIVLKENQTLIGDITVTYRNQSFALSFATLPEFQRQGYMQEALLTFLPYLEKRYPTLNIICLVPKNNPSSQQLLYNLNFKQTQYISDFDCHLYIRQKE